MTHVYKMILYPIRFTWWSAIITSENRLGLYAQGDWRILPCLRSLGFQPYL